MTPRRIRIASLIVLILVSQLFSVTAQDSGYKMEPSQPMIILEKDNTDDLYYEYTVDSSATYTYCPNITAIFVLLNV